MILRDTCNEYDVQVSNKSILPLNHCLLIAARPQLISFVLHHHRLFFLYHLHVLSPFPDSFYFDIKFESSSTIGVNLRLRISYCRFFKLQGQRPRLLSFVRSCFDFKITQRQIKTRLAENSRSYRNEKCKQYKIYFRTFFLTTKHFVILEKNT